MAYASVIVPAWMPKPDLVPLTGGYRRTPVLQLGADISCDMRLILQVLERLRPEPSLFPGWSEGAGDRSGLGDRGCDVVWGASNNSRTFWGRDARAKIGWQPKDSAADYAAGLLGKVTDNPIIEKTQGGTNTSRG